MLSEVRPYLETRQPHEGDEGDAEPHAEKVHERPVAGEDPDADDHNGDGEADQLGQAEATAQAQRYFALAWVGGPFFQVRFTLLSQIYL